MCLYILLPTDGFSPSLFSHCEKMLAWTFLGEVLHGRMFLILLRVYLGVEWLSHVVKSAWPLKEPPGFSTSVPLSTQTMRFHLPQILNNSWYFPFKKTKKKKKNFCCHLVAMTWGSPCDYVFQRENNIRCFLYAFGRLCLWKRCLFIVIGKCGDTDV